MIIRSFLGWLWFVFASALQAGALLAAVDASALTIYDNGALNVVADQTIADDVLVRNGVGATTVDFRRSDVQGNLDVIDTSVVLLNLSSVVGGVS